MPSDTEKSSGVVELEQFNQEALHRELTSALIIRHQMQAIMGDIYERQPTEDVKQSTDKIIVAVDDILKSMLKADSQEVVQHHTQRMQSLLKQVRTKLGEEEGDSALLSTSLADYRFLQVLVRTIRKTDFENAKNILEQLPAWCKDAQTYPAFNTWKKSLEELSHMSSEPAYQEHKEKILTHIVNELSKPNVANLASLSLVQENVRRLTETRQTYLKSSNKQRDLLQDAGWVSLGAGLVIAGSVLSFAFPALLLPGIVVGAVALGYGVMDFAKTNKEIYDERKTQKLGRGTLAEKTRAKLKELGESLSDFDVDDFLKKKQLDEAHASDEEKNLSGISFGISFSGVALAAAGLAVVIPGVGAPLALLIALAVASSVVAGSAYGFLNHKNTIKQKELTHIAQEQEGKAAQDKKEVDALPDQEQYQISLSSTAAIIKAEMANRHLKEPPPITSFDKQGDDSELATQHESKKEPVVQKEEREGEGENVRDQEGESKGEREDKSESESESQSLK